MLKAIFEGLIYSTEDEPLTVSRIGDELFYVLDDEGFLRHIAAGDVDRQVWQQLTAHIAGNEDMLSEQAAKMLGQDDIFSIAVIRSQLENREEQFKALQASGFPADARQYMAMTGFRVTVDHHGEVIEVHQPGMINEDGEE